MGADPWDDMAPDRDSGPDRDPDNIDWGSSVVIALGAVLLVGVIIAALFVGMNSGLLGADGPADSGEPDGRANTTEEETASNETAEADGSAGNGSATPSEDSNSQGSSSEDTAPDGGSDEDDGDTTETETDSSSSSSDSDSGSDGSDTSDSDTDSDSDSEESQEQSNDQQEQKQEQNQDDSSDGDGSDDSGRSEDEDDRPVYDLTVHVINERPVEGADITIKRQTDGATTTRMTGENGEATFPVYAGDYSIRAEGPNGITETTTVTVTDDTDVDMMVMESSETHTLTVTVVDQTGAPIPGVDVIGFTPDAQDADVFGTTNANGQVRLEVYGEHQYVIDVLHPDTDEVVTKEVQVEDDESLRFELETGGAAQQSNESARVVIG